MALHLHMASANPGLLEVCRARDRKQDTLNGIGIPYMM